MALTGGPQRGHAAPLRVVLPRGRCAPGTSGRCVCEAPVAAAPGNGCPGLLTMLRCSQCWHLLRPHLWPACRHTGSGQWCSQIKQPKAMGGQRVSLGTFATEEEVGGLVDGWVGATQWASGWGARGVGGWVSCKWVRTWVDAWVGGRVGWCEVQAVQRRHPAAPSFCCRRRRRARLTRRASCSESCSEAREGGSRGGARGWGEWGGVRGWGKGESMRSRRSAAVRGSTTPPSCSQLLA